MTSFFDQVYAVVRQIPPGKVASYGQVAALLGHPRAARTVGWALAALRENNEPDVPWQRVINSQGRVSIRNLEHAPEEQQMLLEAEGIEFNAQGKMDWKRYGWQGLSAVELEALLASLESY
jgi:methylated-DNA-protein-cysteine methyltransferase-like protein